MKEKSQIHGANDSSLRKVCSSDAPASARRGRAIPCACDDQQRRTTEWLCADGHELSLTTVRTWRDSLPAARRSVSIERVRALTTTQPYAEAVARG